MFYKFDCSECEHNWESNIGEYPVRFITNEPCPKCNNSKCITGTKLAYSPIENTTTGSANLVSGVGTIDNKLDGDFRDFLQEIKNGSKGCNMRDYK